MIFWISCVFLGTLCAAQNSGFQSSVGGSLSSSIGGSGRLNGVLGTMSSSSSLGSAGSTMSSSMSMSQSINVPQPYPLCIQSNPTTAVKSHYPLAYYMLEASFTNPFLRNFYNTSFNTAGFYDAIHDEVRETLPDRKGRILSGSLSLLFTTAYPRITPLLNAVSITNAITEFLGDQSIVIADDKEEYIEALLTSISKAVTDSDGSADAQAVSVVRGLLGFLDDIELLSNSQLTEFVSILAGHYYFAVYSTCKPSTFESIPVVY